jgi:hypothetical protein
VRLEAAICFPGEKRSFLVMVKSSNHWRNFASKSGGGGGTKIAPAILGWGFQIQTDRSHITAGLSL